MRQAASSPFPLWFEWVHLGLPLFFIVAAILLDQSGSAGMVFSNIFLVKFVIAAFLLSNSHIAFSYASLFYLPEMKCWVHDISGGSPRRFWLRCAVIFCVSLAAFSCIFGVFEASLPVFALLLVATRILGLHHILKQTFGISLVYVDFMKQSLTPEASMLASAIKARFRLAQRLCYSSFLIHVTSWFGYKVCEKYQVLSAPLLAELSAVLQWCHPALMATCFVSSGFCFFYARRLGELGPSVLPLFMLRTAMYPLAFVFSPELMTLAVIANHGIEYLATHFAFMKNTALEQKQLRPYLATLAVFYVLAVLFLTGRSDLDTSIVVVENFDMSLIFKIFAVLSSSFTVVHYYIDTKMFRFRTRESREWISPILLRPGDAQGKIASPAHS